jgi:hypothetical protein
VVSFGCLLTLCAIKFLFINCLLLLQILWANRFRNDRRNDCLVSVDGTDCPRKKIRLPNGKMDTRYWSFKFRDAGLRYEVAICILTSDIVSIAGPYMPGVWNDLMIFRDGLRGRLGLHERVEADDGYWGDSPRYCVCPNAYTTRTDQERMRKRLRLRHETVNKRLKQFRCLLVKFRHRTEQHAACFRSAAVLTQLAIEGGEELFDMREYDDRLSDADVARLYGL